MDTVANSRTMGSSSCVLSPASTTGGARSPCRCYWSDATAAGEKAATTGSGGSDGSGAGAVREHRHIGVFSVV